MDRKDFLKLAVAATALGSCTNESSSQPSTPDSRPAPSQTPEDFSKRVLEDVAASLRGALLFIGDRLNIFEAMHGGGALTAQDLAAKTGLDSRLLYEWLKTLAIARYVEYHPDTEAFSLPEAHGEVLANPESPLYAGGAVQAVFPLVNAAPYVAEALETGVPVNAEQYAPELWDAMDRDLFVIYQHSLVQLWLPALDDVTQKLEEGGAILDYGCGRGRATVLMGRSYPNTQVTGIDPFGPSVEAARQRAGEEGVSGRVRFEQGSFDNLPSRPCLKTMWAGGCSGVDWRHGDGNTPQTAAPARSVLHG